MKSKITIREILQDHWDAFTKEYSDMIRPVVLSEVKKVISCGDPSGGFAMYCCPHCGAYKIVPFRCPSRFCNTCGVAYQSARAEVISSKLLNCHHRHIVFTIAEELRIYFRKDPQLLSILFRSAAQVISDWLYERNHSLALKAGMICGLHTFGRDLKWNPHIHMIITEGALDHKDKWHHIRFFPYTMLRKRWMATLLANLKEAIDPDIFPLSDFKKLVIHIPEKGFNMLRYYGLYSKGRSSYPELVRKVSSAVCRLRRSLLKWRYALEIAFGKEPLDCPCGHTMEFSGTYHPHYCTHPPPFMLEYV